MAERRTVVVDAGAFLRLKDFRLSSFLKGGEGDPEFVTTAAVLAEIRDAVARRNLELLLEEPRVAAPPEEDMRAVAAFARRTGDAASLSGTDMAVAALAVKLSSE
eukprot:Polyplicarium_translucidae@DN2175_c0_g1_i2.p2